MGLLRRSCQRTLGMGYGRHGHGHHGMDQPRRPSLLLSPLAFLLLKDYTAKLKMGKDPEFKLSEHPGLKRKIKSDIW